MIDFRELVKAGVHFGHQASRWVPKMFPYIWGVKNKVHLIDVSQTAYHLEKAAKFLEEVAAQDKQILWVGTKKAARSIIQEVAAKLRMPYVNHRWVGGTLTNFSQVKKSITRLLHLEDVLTKSEKYPHYTKKELNSVKKDIDCLNKVVGGIRNLTWPVGAVVLVDVNKEQSALQEAVKAGVPVVALVDTNGDPSLVDYVIPANDDAPRSIKIILDYLEKAVQKGKQKAASKNDAAVKAAAAALEVKDEEREAALKLAEVEAEIEETENKKEAKKVRAVAVAKSVKKEAQREKSSSAGKMRKTLTK